MHLVHVRVFIFAFICILNLTFVKFTCKGSIRPKIIQSNQRLHLAEDPMFPYADSEDSDQTGRTPMLFWVFAGRKGHFVGFVMRRLTCCGGLHWFFLNTYFFAGMRASDWAIHVYNHTIRWKMNTHYFKGTIAWHNTPAIELRLSRLIVL